MTGVALTMSLTDRAILFVSLPRGAGCDPRRVLAEPLALCPGLRGTAGGWFEARRPRLAADSVWPGGTRPRPLQRAAAVVTVFAGAAIGAALVLTLNTAIVIGMAFLVILAVAGVGLRSWWSSEPWTRGIRSNLCTQRSIGEDHVGLCRQS